IAGLIVAGLHPSPAKDADFITTTTHKTLRGPRGGIVMCKKKWASVLDSCIFPGMQGGPLMHVIAGKAVALKEAATQQFKDYQTKVVQNAKTLCEELINRGFKIVSGGTDNHLVLVDLTDKGVNGAQAQEILESAGITVNKNAIPFDPLPPGKASGIRIGTPAITTRNMGTDEMRLIASWISQAIEKRTNESEIARIGGNVRELCVKFPLYSQGKGGV
ncbi:MAG: serine hydroxymethyltransferase, partial [Desulfomonilaceae bacterium]